MDDCMFCEFVRGQRPVYTVLETENALAFLDNKPAAPYHTLVVPKRHSTNVFDIPEDDFLAVAALVKRVVTLYRERLGIQNVELVHCAGAAAQQAVFHLHVHVVPRHEGDGQDTEWTRYPELHGDFDALLARLADPV